MDVLWAPWRMAYVGGTASTRGCIFCIPADADRRERLVLGATAASVVMLNRYPYASGHLLVAPRRHVAALGDLVDGEYGDLGATLRRTVASVEAALGPQGMNVGMNLGACAGAGVLDHLHWHVVPRWSGDTNFMTTVADARVVPQHLLETYDRLRRVFAWLDGAG